MPMLPVYNLKKEEVEQIELSDAIFGVEVREGLFYDAVRYQLAKRRAGTHAVKSRSQVSGGGKKPFRQKGTGRARQGTTRAVHWRGGGVVHGPQVRSHAHKLNKKTRKAALIAALSRLRWFPRIRIWLGSTNAGATMKLAKGWLIQPIKM